MDEEKPKQRKHKSYKSKLKPESLLEMNDISLLDIRVGKIIEAVYNPNSDKLFLLKVQVGENEVR